MAIETGPFSDLLVFVTASPKGGVGKTEVADNLEAVLSFCGRHALMVDIDDGNAGLGRRLGRDNVRKINWTSGARDAAAWVSQHAVGQRAIVFDIGAGLDSSDLPILAMLQSVWRILADGGARIMFCAVISTNARISNFVQRLETSYQGLATVIIICNDQDGSKRWPDGVPLDGKSLAHLKQAQSGVQAVRLLRQALLSDILRHPQERFARATAMLAARAYYFARSPAFTELFDPNDLAQLAALAARRPKAQFATIQRYGDAADETIDQNERVGLAFDALIRTEMADSDILAAATAFRREFTLFKKLTPPG